MVNEINKCVDFEDNRAELILRENGKCYSLLNENKLVLQKYRVDGCFPQNESEGRCDFLVIVGEKAKIYLVELKGGNLAYGLKQIDDTFNFMLKKKNNFSYEGRIVGSRNVPHLQSLPVYKKLVRSLSQTGGSFKYWTNKIGQEKI